MKRDIAVLAMAAASILPLGASPSAKSAGPKTALPEFGTRLGELPSGGARAVADRACQQCHSADMLRQQRLTEKQWTAEVAKMAGWGADVKEEEKADLVAYLTKNFGPDAGPFTPVETKPFPKVVPAH